MMNAHSTLMGRNNSYGEVKNILSRLPLYSVRPSINEYHKQLVESRSIMYHQQSLRLLSKEELADPVAKRDLVVKKVARELWTNFCVRGQKTPSLDFLHERLKDEFGRDLEFFYRPGSIELIMMRQTEGELKPIDRIEQLDIINKAWELAQEVVGSYTT